MPSTCLVRLTLIVVFLIAATWAIQTSRFARGYRRSLKATSCATWAAYDEHSFAVDYRQRAPAVLSAVKAQASCGDCWAFAATEQVETYVALKYGVLLTLSAQQVTSCTLEALGCHGGDVVEALEFLVNLSLSGGGLVQADMYPFTDAFNGDHSFGAICQYNFTEMTLYGYAATLTGCMTVNIDPDGHDLKRALTHIGPLAVSVNSSLYDSFYQTDNIVEPTCATTAKGFDHAVQLVGYGTETKANGTTSYWIIRNQWSTLWGNNGYLRVRAGADTCDGFGAVQLFGEAVFPVVGELVQA